MDYQIIDFERDYFPNIRRQASQVSELSCKIKKIIVNGTNSTFEMLTDTYNEASSNMTVLKYWLALLLIRIKKDYHSIQISSFEYFDYIYYFASIESSSICDCIYKEYSIPLSFEITSCSAHQLIHYTPKLLSLSKINQFFAIAKLISLRLKQEALNQMQNFIQIEEITSCEIIINILKQCIVQDNHYKTFLNLVIKKMLEKFIENHDLTRKVRLKGRGKTSQYQKMKDIIEKILEIEEFFNNSTKKLMNIIIDSPILKNPPKRKKRSPKESLSSNSIDLNNLNYENPIDMKSYSKFSIEVRKGVNRNNQTIILKHYHSFSDEFDFKQIEKEIDILTFVSNHSDSHKNYCKIYYVLNDHENICIWMEDGGINLMNFITKMKQKGQKIPSNVIEMWIKVLLENFAWLANNGIFHRDIKPHNLLVNEQDMTLKIIDFGVGDISEIESTFSPTMEFPIQGTSGYMAPELCEALEKNLSSDYHKPGKSDVFSLGLTFYQLITFENISGLNVKLNNKLLLQKVQELNCKVWVKKLLECMLQYEWRKRPSFGKLLCFIPSENTNENSISRLIPLSVDLDSIVFQTRLVYSHTFPTFDVKILRGVTRDNIPIIKKQYFSFTQDFDPSHILKEIEIMTLLSNQKTNINTFIRLYDVKRTPDEISLFMEDGGENLMNFLTKTKKNGQVLPPNVLEEWVKILLNSFAYLYNMKIFHRDIKPHNILVNEKDMTLKIIDFGIGDFIERDSTFSTTMEFPIQGAFGYMAPELCEALQNNSRVAFYKPGKSDVFSLGLTFYQLLTCENLQGMNIKLNNQVLLQKVQKLNCKVWIKNLLHSMLQYEWRKRPSFNKLLSFIPSDRDTQ